MPRYASLDEDGVVNGFYDTDKLIYKSLPETLVDLNDEDWTKRMTQTRWVIVDGRLQPESPG